MSAETTTIVPGLLVGLKTALRGGVTYETSGESVLRDGKTEERQWTTRCEVQDTEELKKAKEARNKAANMIRNSCIRTPFGLLCRVDQRDKLLKRIGEARAVTSEFNKSAKYTNVNVSVIMGEIANTDREAARAILSDVQDAIDQMKQGLKEINVTTIREAAAKAKQLGQMLSTNQSAIVSDAVKAARAAAREIVKRVEKGGELAKKVVKELSLKPINDIQFCNLDEDSTEEPMVVLPSVSVQRAASLDMSEDSE